MMKAAARDRESSKYSIVALSSGISCTCVSISVLRSPVTCRYLCLSSTRHLYQFHKPDKICDLVLAIELPHRRPQHARCNASFKALSAASPDHLCGRARLQVSSYLSKVAYARPQSRFCCRCGVRCRDGSRDDVGVSTMIRMPIGTVESLIGTMF